MKTRFEIGDKVVWAVVPGENDHTFRLIYGSQPMEIVDMYYQRPTLEPCNATQASFKKAGYWPLFANPGLIYTVRYRPDNNYCENRLLSGKDYGETLIHEKWLHHHDVHEEFKRQADFLDQFQDYLDVKFAHWLFEQYNYEEDGEVRYRHLCDFREWMREEIKHDLNAKRGHTGLSYAEARDEYETNSVRSHSGDNSRETQPLGDGSANSKQDDG